MYLIDCEVLSHYGFDLHLMISNVKHFFMCLLAICLSLKKCLFRSFTHFLVELCVVIDL